MPSNKCSGELTFSTSWHIYEIHSSFKDFPLEALRNKDKKITFKEEFKLYLSIHWFNLHQSANLTGRILFVYLPLTRSVMDPAPQNSITS